MLPRCRNLSGSPTTSEYTGAQLTLTKELFPSARSGSNSCMATLTQSATQVAQPFSSPIPPVARPRLDSVDLLRGLIMILMALDHTRGFFSNVTFYPLDL